MDTTDEVRVQYHDFGDAEFDGFVKATLEEFLTPGMAVLVVHGDKTYAQGYGLADMENGIATTPHTLFQTGSTTKSFTAAMAAHLVESSEFPNISWTTRLTDLIPEDFVLDQSTAEGRWATVRTTLEDALCHRTGIARHDLVWINGDPTTKDIVRSLRHLPLHSELRMKYEYNNTMYTAVAHAVECTLDQPYKSLLKAHIFDPLRMHNTAYTVVDAVTMAEQDANITFADGYWWNSTSQEFEQVPLSDIAPSKGSGGMISNVLNYSRWVRHLMQPTDLNPGLSHNAVKEMRTPRTMIEPSKLKPYVGPQAYGLGLYCQVYRGREIIQHAGASPGHMSLMMTVPPGPTEDPGSGWAVVIMQNTWSLAMDIVAWHLLDRFLGTPKDERHDMAGAARKAQEEKSSMLESENVISRLFGSLKLDRSIQPSLPLDRLNGIYRHIAYHEFKISEIRAPGRNDSEVTLLLQPSGSRKTYYSLTATLHHVSGGYWWAHRRIGPGNWLTDEALKVFFVVGSIGVQGMNFQAEPTMPDFLPFFEKVA